jgi:hypothetical protein
MMQLDDFVKESWKVLRLAGGGVALVRQVLTLFPPGSRTRFRQRGSQMMMAPLHAKLLHRTNP